LLGIAWLSCSTNLNKMQRDLSQVAKKLGAQQFSGHFGGVDW
jgi:hypothetical protein